MDLVYILKHGDDNESLKYSLRSIEKYAPDFGKIIMIGGKPNWIQNVEYIRIPQMFQRKWLNAKLNFMTACYSPIVSNDFVLMNDDFILNKPIKNWQESLAKVKNTIDEQIAEYNQIDLYNNYTKAFEKLLEPLKLALGKDILYNYELHIPMIVNKQKFQEMIKCPEIKDIMDYDLALYRSIYGNYSSAPFNQIIDDVKLEEKTDFATVDTEWISVFDRYIGNLAEFPLFNKFLAEKFPDKCRYEI